MSIDINKMTAKQRLILINSLLGGVELGHAWCTRCQRSTLHGCVGSSVRCIRCRVPEWTNHPLDLLTSVEGMVCPFCASCAVEVYADEMICSGLERHRFYASDFTCRPEVAGGTCRVCGGQSPR